MTAPRSPSRHGTHRWQACPRRNGFITIAAVVGLWFAASGCVLYSDGAALRLGGTGTIAIIGDSITDMSTGPLVAEGHHRGWFVHVSATGGSMTVDKQAAAEAIGATQPQVVVVHLGTNDVFCAVRNAFSLLLGPCRFPTFTMQDIAVPLRTMAAALRRPGTCIVGVSTYISDVPGRVWTEMVGAGLANGVADWRSQAISHRLPYLWDEIGHLTLAGQVAYAAFIYQEVARICQVAL